MWMWFITQVVDLFPVSLAPLGVTWYHVTQAPTLNHIVGVAQSLHSKLQYYYLAGLRPSSLGLVIIILWKLIAKARPVFR